MYRRTGRWPWPRYTGRASCRWELSRVKVARPLALRLHEDIADQCLALTELRGRRGRAAEELEEVVGVGQT